MSSDKTSNYFLAEYKNFFLLFVIFVAPHVGLDYVYRDNLGNDYMVAYGQYFAFFFTVSSTAFLIKFNPDILESVLRHRKFFLFLFLSLFLIIVGLLLSNTSAWGWRVLFIIMVFSVCSMVGALYVNNLSINRQKAALLLLALPFFLPIIFACFLELSGPIEFFLEWHNTKHGEYHDFRWHFLNSSANSFGLDAVVSFIIFFSIFFGFNNINLKVLIVILMAISIFCLIKSGTRSAMVLGTIFFAMLFCFYLNLKQKIFFVAIIMTIGFLFVNVWGFSELQTFFRLDGSLNQISSGRLNAMKTIFWDAIKNPFIGQGFGEADKSFSVKPVNFLYISLFAEVGLISLFGFVLLLFLPVLLFINSGYLRYARLLREQHFSIYSSFSFYLGLLVFQIFEFSIFRVSVTNQLFFFLWGFLVFNCIKQNRFSLIRSHFEFNKSLEFLLK